MADWRTDTPPKMDGLTIEIPQPPKLVTYFCAERLAGINGGSANDYEAGWYDEDEDEFRPKLWRPAPPSEGEAS